ncbi:hypothetical protein [Flavobacterium aquiphilum]|uniref:hypothetical protein n=1 Tax=Flavobacterium aquiphilum TaxID=3003261 RepID=UPI0024815060|nr:hypothetical protein [Flavobacterium aquiphilum]
MKKTLNVIILLFAFGNIFCQTENLNQNRYRFAKKVFEKEYLKTAYKKFRGKITIVDDFTIKYDEKTLNIPNSKEEYRLIFTSGIFYPNIVTGNEVAEIKTKNELDKMTKDEKIFYNITRTDSISIGSFDELTFLNPNINTKRFQIWIFRKGEMNPTECYFEIQNVNATKETKPEEFVKKAKLTFFKSGTIIM